MKIFFANAKTKAHDQFYHLNTNPVFLQFYYMSRANLESLLYGDVCGCHVKTETQSDLVLH